MRNSMLMRCLDTPDRNMTRDRARMENLSKPPEGKNPVAKPTLSGVNLTTNKVILKDMISESMRSKHDASHGLLKNRIRVKSILGNVRKEQKAQFSNTIKSYYQAEHKYDVMPTIRVSK